jgi:uncharacterized protein (TIGR03437 family)
MKKSTLSGAVFLALAIAANAQQARIAGPVNNLQRMTLRGHVHPNARAEFDQGRVSPSLEMDSMSVTLAPSPAQQADLNQLLAAQQTPGSASYHHWLHPEEFAQRFGASQSDIQAISAWLQSQGFNVLAVARGRNSIAFRGTAAQVESAFQMEVHNYLVNGKVSYANASDPTIPAAFNGVVTGVRGLHSFRMRAHSRALAKPNYTSADGVHQMTPGDFAVIYNVAPLYAAGIDGTGQTMVVAGQTTVELSDIETFRDNYGLPANNPTMILAPNSRSPGLSKDDLPEADLDLELAGGVARNATILFVYASDVMVAVQYAIDQDLAPVVSVSYGSCEQETGSSDIAAFQAWAQQGNAQGITWFAASGDDGAADCADTQNPGYAVDTPGSVPEVTSMGGTQLVDGTGSYWSATNTASGVSALSYIPETTWNTSAADGEPSASGGGASIVFGKPSWQTGPGVPNDNARDVPDLSLAASPDHDGYFVFTGGSLQVFGGTSVAAPSFAGITVLLNQYQVSKGIQSSPGQGNINPALYSLAQTNPSAFHDVTTGNNVVTVACSHRTIVCSNTPVGYYAGAGFDEATGLGSVDAYNLITGWSGAASTPAAGAAVITLLANLKTIAPSEVTYLTASVTSSDGATPTGSVTFEADGTSLGSAALTGVGVTATATLAVNGGQLPLGSATLTALYNGSSNVTASVAVDVTASGASGSTPSVTALVNPASYKTAVAPGGILTVFGSQLAPSGSSAVGAASLPLPVSLNGVAALINGVAAPLYYASTGLLNIEIPYQIPPGPATLSINNNGSVITQTLTVSAAAPAIFTDTSGGIVPTQSSSRGQIAYLYITGAGAVSPVVSTGSAPSSSTPLAELPAPTQATTVTVAGAPATIQFIGITPGLAGVMQINFEVPTSIGTGPQQVSVTIGGVSSPAAILNVAN